MTEIKLELGEKQKGCFNLYEDNIKVGEMALSIRENVMTVYHTEVERAARGRGVARQLFDKMVFYVREKGLMVVPKCPYVHAQFKKNRGEYADIWKKG